MDTQRWTSMLDETTQNFRMDFGSLTAEQLNWKANPKAWSIAQNVDHLIVINKTYFPVIDAVKNKTYKLPWTGKVGFLVRFFGKMILNSIRPENRKKMKTFPLWEPSQSTIDADILDKFSREQDQLKKLISESSGLLDQGTVISSPANANIVYKLETAFDIMVTHERRHLEQARDVLREQRSM